MTFSIVAHDRHVDPPEWGVAVASKFLAVGSVVSWARAGVGAVATQALANIGYGPNGLELLSEGRSAEEAVELLTQADEDRDHRQLGIVDATGRAATFTGSRCFDWAGGRAGRGYCCQGNILASGGVIDEMAAAFEAADGELSDRLLAALAAGDAAGGDRRGRQSAAILVVREGGGYGGGTDKSVDLRVDDHADPVPELRRLFHIHRLLFPRPEDLDFIDIDSGLAAELRRLLGVQGQGATYDEELKQALFSYVGTENFEERWTDQAKIDRGLLEHLRAHVKSAS